MSVHGRSFLQYWCREYNYSTGVFTAHGWKDLDGGDLNRVEYEDSIYSPARLHVVISNRDMNNKLSSASDTSAGMYTVEGEVSYPTFNRFQPIRLFHVPRPLYTKAIAHNGGATAGGEITFTLAGHGMAVGDRINLINESTGAMEDGLFKVKAVTTNTFTLYRRNSGINIWAVNITGTGTSGTVVLHSEVKYSMYPMFYGRIDSVDVSYNDNVGKTISIVALDYLSGLRDEIITASRIGAPSRSTYDDAFGDTTLKDGTENGQFKPVSYPDATSTAAHKLSATVKGMVSDWSYGRDIYTDNTYDGTNTLGESKFENSSFEFHGKDDAKFRHFAGRETTVLNAMKNVAMTERHAASENSVGSGGVPVSTSIKYVAAGSTDYSALVTTGTNRDVVFQKAAHGYVDGNMVTVSDDTMPIGTDHIDFASWVVTAASDGYFKIKDMGGNVKQIADAATGSPPTLTRVAKISPGVTGSFGYDFYVDAGLYASTINIADQQLAHRPHLNYFLRGSRPVDPSTTGLTLQYPSQGDEAENTFGWGTATSSGRINTTKMFLMPQFEHGLHAEDLYSHIGLASVGSDDSEPSDINDLGHKMELIKINSIAAEDWVAALPSSTEAERRIQRAYSGQWGKFHWDRSDSATGLGNYTAGADDTDNQNYFRSGDGAYLSDGTYGVITAGKGGDAISTTTCTGLMGLSVLPTTGRSFTFPPDQPTDNSTKSRDTGDPAHTTDEVKVGGEALAAADLIKDVWNVDSEGLLGSEVTCTSTGDETAGARLVVENTGHGLETGNIIKVTQFGTATSGTVGNIAVGTAPTRASADAPTTATGSYYRVQRKDDDEFYITDVQKHSTQLERLPFTVTAASNVFKYKLAYNVFKHACRVQYVTGDTFATGTKDTVLRTTETKADADYALISDVKKTDKPYPSINVNNLVVPNAASGAPHPKNNLVTVVSEYSLDGTIQATKGLGYGTVPHTGTDGVLVTRFQESGDNVKVRFLPGDHISETRFLYHDNDLGGIIGRALVGPGSERSSKDLFISKNFQILERMVDSKSISKTYQLKYNESASSKNSIRSAAVQILKRAILPSKRTTCKVFGYPIVKLTGPAQDGTGYTGGNTSASADEDFLVPVDNPLAYGGRAGMLVEKTTGLDGPTIDMVLPDTITSAGIKGEMLGGETWSAGDFYRMYIHLRAGMSVRVQHPAAGVIGNHICTRLTYYERMGTTETTIETTGYDEAAIKKQGQLSMLLETIKTAGSNVKPAYITVKKLSKNPFSPGS